MAQESMNVQDELEQCELSVAMHKSEAIGLGQPVMPVADGFLC